MSDAPRSAYLVADARHAMRAIPDNSVGIVVTSPPYLADKEYEEGWSNEMYWGLIGDFVRQSARILPPGGWLCINIGMIPKKGHKDGAHQTNVHHRMAVMMEDSESQRARVPGGCGVPTLIPRSSMSAMVMSTSCVGGSQDAGR
jgi:DNA modification methylase